MPVDVEVQNMSPKTITAYKISLVAHFGDGAERRTEYWIECIGQVAMADERLEQPFVPGWIRHDDAYVGRVPGGMGPLYVLGDVTMVIFSDRTALGDRNAINDALQQRSRNSRYLADLLTEVRSAQADPAVVRALQRGESDGTAMLRTAISGMISHDTKLGDKPDWHEFRTADLKSLDRALVAGMAAFDARLRFYEGEQRGLALHSTLAEEGR